MKTIQMSKWLFASLVLAICYGCSGESGPKTVPVSGTVSVQGKPMEGVTVSFIPDGGEGMSAVGVTDASGNYLLTTRVKDDGAVPGKYKVTFAKYDAPEGPVTDPSEADSSLDTSNQYPPGYDEAKVAAQPTQPAKNLLADKYSDPNTSGFTAEVVDGENDNVNFDIKD